MDIPIPIFYLRVESLSSVSVNKRPKIYNPNQESTPTVNISFMLDSKEQIVLLVLGILLNNKKSLKIDECAKNGIKNEKLDLINWVDNWNFKYTKVCRRNIK